MTKPSSEAYWWRAAPLAQPPPVAPRCDVAIIGAGYTGLSAAIMLARAGRSVQVFDKQRPGEGASTRNGGITSGNLRPSDAQLARKFGPAAAAAIQAEGKAAREDLYRFIADEKIDCDFKLVGRFAGAYAPKDYDALARSAELLHDTLGIEAYAVSRPDQRNFIGSDTYFGGNVRMDIGGLHPAKFHAGMLRVALEAGVTIHGETAVTRVREQGEGWAVDTCRGTTLVRDVLTCTNGYTDRSDRWLRRRLIPVRSRIIATAPISPNLMGELMPRRMMCTETRQLHYYYRPSPDGTRILFGGRDGTVGGDPAWPTEALRRAMISVFPMLNDTQIEHSWFGNVAINMDMIPRIFARGGKRYAAGLLRQRHGLGPLGRSEGGAADPGGCRWRLDPGPGSTGSPAVVRGNPLVHARGLRVDDGAGQGSGPEAGSCAVARQPSSGVRSGGGPSASICRLASSQKFRSPPSGRPACSQRK